MRFGWHFLLQGLFPFTPGNIDLFIVPIVLTFPECHVGRAITSWQTDEENVEAVTDFIFLGSKITEDSDCSHKIKRSLLLGEKLWQT